MAWGTWLRGAGLAVALAAALWGVAAQGQERPVLRLVEAGGERLVVAWAWGGDEDPAAFSVHWRWRVSGAEWEEAELAGSARGYSITGLRPESAYIVRVRALDARGRGVRVGGGRLFDLRGVFDTIRLPVPGAPSVAFDGERAAAAWDAFEGATGYELVWGTAGATSTERVGAGVLEFETGELAAGRRYEFRVRSLHGRDRSELSGAAVLATAAWPHAAPAARFEFHRAAGMLVEWEAVAGVERYVVAWEREGDAGRSGEMEAEGTSALVTREGGFFTGSWRLRVRAAGGGLWSEKTRVWVESPAPELRFSLESSRELCTEGTLTEIRWRGGGGGGNLWPHVDGRMIGENTYRVKVNCGMIPRGEDGEIDESRRDAVITGFLRDGRGVVRSASIRVARAEALPAPTEAGFAIDLSVIRLAWDAVAGAGEQSPLGTDQRHVAYALRVRPVGRVEWTIEVVETRQLGEYHVYRIARSPEQEWEFAVAAVRHPFEIETPSRLNWSNSQKFRAVGKPQNLSVDASHESMTVRFDRQPHSGGGYIEIRGPRGVTSEQYLENGEEGRHAIVVDGLSPNEEYQITVRVFSSAIVDSHDSDVGNVEARATVRTKAAPDGWTAPARGPENIRATSTHDSITVQWDPPQPDRQAEWDLTLRLVSTDEYLDGYLIDSRAIPANAETVWTTFGNALRGSIKPDTTYRIRITQLGVQDHWEEVLVVTPSDPDGALGQDSHQDDPTKHATESFVPIWPLQIDAGHRMTDDPRVWRGFDYHSGF